MNDMSPLWQGTMSSFNELLDRSGLAMEARETARVLKRLEQRLTKVSQGLDRVSCLRTEAGWEFVV